MFRKILKYVGLSLVILCLGIYFIHASNLKKKGEETEICSDIRVTVTDSAKYGFVRAGDIEQYIKESSGNYIGTKVSDINLYELEQRVNGFNAIKESSASIDRKGVVRIKVSQRKPLFRLQSSQKALYVDETGYIFAPSYSFAAYVPVITGQIPITYNKETNETMSDGERVWIANMIRIISHINSDSFLSAQIQQIDIGKGGDIVLYPMVGDQRIIFGQPDNLESKFERFMAFYDHIVPNKGWSTYSEINLSYSDQIVCKKKK